MFRELLDQAGGYLQAQHVAFGDQVPDAGTLHRGERVVDAVTIEESVESLGSDGGDSKPLQKQRSGTTRPGSEIAPTHQNVPRSHFINPSRSIGGEHVAYLVLQRLAEHRLWHHQVGVKVVFAKEPCPTLNYQRIAHRLSSK